MTDKSPFYSWKLRFELRRRFAEKVKLKMVAYLLSKDDWLLCAKEMFHFQDVTQPFMLISYRGIPIHASPLVQDGDTSYIISNGR